eukprot:3527140-Rhodomonas_salina.1
MLGVPSNGIDDTTPRQRDDDFAEEKGDFAVMNMAKTVSGSRTRINTQECTAHRCKSRAWPKPSQDRAMSTACMQKAAHANMPDRRHIRRASTHIQGRQRTCTAHAWSIRIMTSRGRQHTQGGIRTCKDSQHAYKARQHTHGRSPAAQEDNATEVEAVTPIS